MACEVCEHCQKPFSHNEAFTVREGYSYHEKCHKCYVCSETNLQDAEVFKGAIFCHSCSQRIFQGCATARKIKNTNRRSRERSHKRRSPRTQDRRVDRRHNADNIIELTTLAVSTDSSNASGVHDSPTSTLKLSVPSKEPLTVQTINEVCEDKLDSLRKNSAEMGMTTDMTQELLKQMKCPVVTERRNPVQHIKPKTITEKDRKKMAVCSDLRIAELGTSTEIANMALKNKSELPVIIKSDTRIGQMESLSLSVSNHETDESVARENWMDSAYSSLGESTKTHWMDRRLRSILKLPYKAFKKNILARSSLINVLMTCENDMSLRKRLKLQLFEEVTDHRKRGLKQLFPTINRKKTPNKLGWPTPDVYTETQNTKTEIKRSSGCGQHRKCAHFRTSHSYRCMRAQFMRLAGPTASELGQFRKKVKKFVSPKFVRNFQSYNKKYAAIMMCQACGTSLPSTN